MTLNDLRDVINFTFYLTDDEVDAEFYIHMEEIPEEIARQIEIVKIDLGQIRCKLTNFIRRTANFHPTKIADYLNENYYDGDQKDYLINQLTKRKKGADIIDDGGEAVYHFITNDMYDYITSKGE